LRVLSAMVVPPLQDARSGVVRIQVTLQDTPT
jgi:hypothetical protein